MASVNTKGNATLEAARAAHMESGQRLAAALAHMLKMVCVAVLIALFVRMFIVQPFSIPSRSMAPLLDAGDFIFVDKTSYGWSRAALPLQKEEALLPGESFLGLDVPGVRAWALQMTNSLAVSAPAPGDVIVFVGPGRVDARRVDYVKRVIARGGERIALTGGRVLLNGRALACEPVGPDLCRETLPGGARYVVHETGHGILADFAEIVVPEGHYFVLGDNRDDSADSRLSVAQGGVGLVPDALVVGRARHIFFSLGDGGVRWDRIGRVAQ